MERRDLNVHPFWLAACCVAAPIAVRADTIVHMKSPIYGCEKVRATRALNNQADPRQKNPRWVAYVMGDGQCVRITTQSPWAVIGGDDDGVTLVSYRGSVGRPASFYVPTSALDLPALAPPQADASPQTAAPVDPSGAGAAGVPSVLPAQPTDNGSPPGAADAQQPTPDGGQNRSLPAAPSETPKPASGLDQPTDDALTKVTPQQSSPAVVNDQDLSQLKADIAKVDPPMSSVIGPLFVFFAIVAILAVVWVVIARSRAADRASLLAAIGREITFNTQALRVKRIHTVQRDDFGTVNWEKWLDARAYYFRTRIQPIVDNAGFSSLPTGFAETIDDMIEAAATSTPAMGSVDDNHANFVSSPETYDPRMNPVDYEIFCALQLQRAGWDTRTTVTTGDQGADVIAKQAGKVLVVQCKLYSNPVGNDAVQQVHAAKAFQSAQIAAVVSNQPFTRSAKQLASISGVYLLHHEELQSFKPPDLGRAAL